MDLQQFGKQITKHKAVLLDAHCGPKTDFTVFILPTLFAGLCVRGAFQTLFFPPESQIAGC